MATFDPKKYSFSFGGIPVNGYADGTGIEFVRNEDMWALVVGMDDFSTFVKKNNTSGLFTITLQQSSPVNNQFSSLAALDETGNLGLQSALLKDNNVGGTTLVSSATGRFVKFPDITISSDLSNTVWTILCTNTKVAIGGNI